MTPSRRGFLLPTLALAVSAAGLLAMIIFAGAADRLRQAGAHQARIQGREWCLGARSLPPGSSFTAGAWQVEVDAQGIATAHGPLGTYRIAANGDERWSRRP